MRSAGREKASKAAAKTGTVQTSDAPNATSFRQPREDGPDVSVVMFASNNERHIRKCIRSILSQRGSFSYEVIVLDGDSSDHTMNIVHEEFGADHEMAFRIEPGQPVVCSARLLTRLFSSVRGRYVAFISGNDEWVRATKIQDQLDFLERRRECFGSFTNYFTRHVSTARFHARTVQDDDHSLVGATQLIRNNLIWPLSAAMFRCDYLRELTFQAVPIEHLAWLLSLQLCPQGLLGIQHQVMTLVNDDASRTEAAQGEINRSAALAHLRDYDELTRGAFKEDFQALAVALRNEIAHGAAW